MLEQKILIIDDNKADLDYFSAALTEEGYKISTVLGGEEGLKLLALEMPDLVILDLVMPKMDGFDVCRRIQGDDNLKHIPVLMLTIKTYLDDKVMGFELGASDFIAKSCDIRELKARVRGLLRAKKLYDDIKRLSIIDSLTNVYNRRYFQHRLYDEFERAKRYNRNFSCLILDIDTFKEINDGFGHPTGDIVLKKVSSVLRRSMRAADVLCRYGGDEFVVILPETNADGAFLLAERIRQMIEKKDIGSEERSIFVTVSGGISSYLEAKNLLSVDELVTQADVALYRAKKLGRNRIMIYGMEQYNDKPSQVEGK